MRIILLPPCLHIAGNYDFRICVGQALFHVKHTLPCTLRLSQFGLCIASLGENPPAFSCGQMVGYLEQPGERRDRACSDRIERPLDALDPRVDDMRSQAERFADPVEEIRAKPAWLD